MFKIYNRHTGEEISCEDKEQIKLMLKNPNFVKTKNEIKVYPEDAEIESSKPKTTRRVMRNANK